MIKRLLIVLLLCSLTGAIAPGLSASERAETLRAINWVENPTNHTRRGSKGELGPYQFRAQTWHLHTKRPFNLAIVREHADDVAVRHYEWIKRGLREAGIEPSPFNIALAWNSGLGAVLRGQVPTVSYHYAERVTNLVESQQARRAVASVTPDKPTPAPAVQFSLAATTPRFSLAADSLYEPVVITEKSTPSAAAVPRIAIDEKAFSFASVTAPRFALLQ
jgi:hypothetical protein